MLVLEELSGRLPAQRFDSGPITIGRHPQNHVVLEAYSMVSGTHARISHDGSEWVLEDLNSTNGTFCNGLRAKPGVRTVLKAGDCIQLGTHGPVLKVTFKESQDAVSQAVRVRFLSGARRGGIELLPVGSTVVGTDPGAGIRFDPGREQGVKPRHARLTVGPSRVTVQDLTGVRELFLNGTPVEYAEVHHRDRLMFGRGGPEVELEVLQVQPSEPTAVFPVGKENQSGGGGGERGVGAGVGSAGPGPARTERPRAVPLVQGERAQGGAGGREPRRVQSPALSSGASGKVAGVPAVPERGGEGSHLLKSLRFGRPRRRTSGEETSGASSVSPRVRLALQVVLLLALLGLTCVLGIVAAMALTGKDARAAVVVESSVRFLSVGPVVVDSAEASRDILAQDVESVLAQLRVPCREVPDDALEEIQRYEEETRDREPHRRAAPYLPEIRRVLAQHDLPQPLMYLPWVESRFDPGARSHAGAVGLWQFVDHTGRRFRIRTYAGAADERRDWVRETVAAAEYLEALLAIDRPGWDTLLALAAYNRGEDKILANLDTLEQETGGSGASEGACESLFWALRRHGDLLPRETREYVPRFLGATVYFVFPEHYP